MAAVVALKMLMQPMTTPSRAPSVGPSKMAPMITGMCSTVMDTGGTVMKDRGVRPTTSSMAMSSESWVRCKVR